MTRRGWLVAAAVLCVLATWPPLLIGTGFGIHALRYWGVLSAYLGISWLVPGILAGLAATAWARDHGRERAGAIGTGIGVGLSAGLIVGVSSLLVALGAGDETTRPGPVSTGRPAADRPGRVALVEAAAHRTGYAAVDRVVCDRSAEYLCVVTFAGPACQLWRVESVSGVDTARALGGPQDGGRGTYDGRRDSVGCFVELSP